MYVSQLQTIQGLISDLSLLALNGADAFHQALQATLPRPDDQIAAFRFVDVDAANRMQARGLLFQLHSDPKALSRLILPENGNPAAALHLALPFDGDQPMLVDLLYLAGGRRRKVDVASYFFSGALATYEDPRYGYTLVRSEKHHRSEVERLAELFRILNQPVQNLPYPAGRKLLILDIFKRLNIRRVGDLVQYDAEQLKRNLGAIEWVTVRSILKGLRLEPGSSIPQWRRPPVE